MQWRDFLPLFIAFAVSTAVTAYLIPFLKKVKTTQTEREEGVKSHLAKAGTPTMGGIAILAGILVVVVIYAPQIPMIIPVMILTIGFGIIGFLDDYLKVILRRSDGLLPWQKLLLEFAVTTLYLIYLERISHAALDMIIPFAGLRTINIGPLAFPFAYIVILATVNGVNFTDGVDGLASSVTLAAALFFTCASVILKAGITSITLAVMGALMGFLVFNAHPAKIFMGDTGSLALGGFVAGTAYMLHMPLFIPIFGFIYAFELLSVVMQVSYFKITHGKRIFRMTPIHHHFEMCGWSETQIVFRFTILTILLCALSLGCILN